MRLTIRFLVKSFIFIIILLFLLPLLMNHMDSQEHKSKEHYISKIKKRNGVDNVLRFEKHYDPNNESPENGNEPGHQIPLPQQHIPDPDAVGRDVAAGAGAGAGLGPPEPEEPTKVYGPKATYKDGILGNFEPRNLKNVAGPGEKGEPVYTSMSEKQTADRSVREFGFNMVASDKIAMDRIIPDTRLDECKYWHYPEKLPNASVIIVFHNEGWSTLMRTVHSVINMSPAHLLHEVVMVDDFSDKEHLKGRLETYIKETFPPGKVKLFRNEDRKGLIMTRTLGAKYSTGEAIVFLDAHCECNRNWLVPLLARIAYDRTIMAVPIVDSINWESFAYRSTYGHGGVHFRGIFEWGFLYKESRVPQKELDKRERNSEPYWSPTHAGGLFAMERKYFFELGAYDEGLQIWGGENFELSFKIWQCGGSIEWVPCSHVGHVYRNAMPYGFGKISPKIPIILINYMRVVEVWLDDEFKEYFYTREPTIRGYPIGDISKQLQFKKEHKCKSFKWFMDNIAYEVYEKFPPPPPNHKWGEIKEKNGFQCWDTMGQRVGGGAMGITPCHHLGGNQMFRLNRGGQMAVGERCIDVSGAGVAIVFCPVQPTGPWKWDEVSGLMHHSGQGKCMWAGDNTKLQLKACDEQDPRQQWVINNVKTW